jgi:hypothetical protein
LDSTLKLFDVISHLKELRVIKAFGFLDYHLGCGGTLIGLLDPKILDESIPAEAFKAVYCEQVSRKSVGVRPVCRRNADEK